MARMFGSKMMSDGSTPACLGQQLVGALADLDLALDGVGLALLVERHHDHRRAVAPDGLRLVQEIGFAFLEADRVDDRLALHALQAGFDHRPLRAVDHHRHARDLGLGGDVVEELGHAGFRVEHALVHVDVDDVGAAAHLVERDGRRAGPVLAFTSRSNFFEPVTLVRSPIIWKLVSGRIDERLQAGQARQAGRPACRRRPCA